MKTTSVILTSLCGVLLLASGCSRFVDTPIPTNKILASNAFSNDATATSVLLSAYASLSNTWKGQARNTDLFADELYNPNAGGFVQESQENTYTETTNYGLFENYYAIIYTINSTLEALDGTNGVSAATAKQIKGESRFLRAFCYFQLLNLYGAPPLITGSDARVSSQVPNTPATQTMQFIIDDLTAALDLVSANYPSDDRVRVNKAAVNAFLARVYLYNKDWVKAEAAATEVIGETYTMPGDLTGVFVKSSNETIWQFWSQEGYTSQAITYIPANGATVSVYRLRNDLLAAFDPVDKRKAEWIKAGSDGNYYPFKYRRASAASTLENEYDVQLRLAEQYLIRAEARAHQDNVTDGLKDLNAVRFRAGVLDAEAASPGDLLEKIEQERRLELMVENGHRWFDLKRTGRSSFWLAPQKPTWLARDTILPYYFSTLLKSPKLDQNDGYQQ